MRIVVTGRQGQVVSALRRLAPTFGIELIPLGRPEADLNDADSFRALILATAPDVIVSAAAYTQVDKAESEPDLAMRMNAQAPGILAAIAAQADIPIIHLSTDYVFDGSKSTPYVETDIPGPLNLYGASKLAGEAAVKAAAPNHVILRTTWVYSPFGANFVKTMLRLSQTYDEVRVVDDQLGAPTSAFEIARAIFKVAQSLHANSSHALRGLFHMTATGETSWAGFAEVIFAGAAARGGRRINVVAIPTSDYPTPARRPLNSRLDCEKFHSIYGLRLEAWDVSLQTCLDELIGKTRSDHGGTP